MIPQVEEDGIAEPETDARAYARVTDHLARAVEANDLGEALRFACGAHLLAPTSGQDIQNLAQVHLYRREYAAAAAWFERAAAASLINAAAIRLLIFAAAQAGNQRTVARWTSRLPALAAAFPPGPDAVLLRVLADVIPGYADWSRTLSAPPTLRFFDENDESEDSRLLRKALLAAAEGLFQRALQLLSTLLLKDDIKVARSDVEALQARLCATLGIDRERLGTGPERGVLLIRSHSSGFTADLFHVATQLVVAALARRSPIVHWGRESAYWRLGSENLWCDFFEPIGSQTIADLAREARTFHPPFFNPTNLADSQNRPWFHNQQGASHETLLGRSEDVVVAERFSSLPEVLSLLPVSHPWRQEQPLILLRSLFGRFIKIRADLAGRYADWLSEHANGLPVVAVHYRLQSSHKIAESAERQHIAIEHYFDAIDASLAREPDARIFLLTDYEPAVDAFRRRYADRIFCHAANRLTSSSVANIQLGLSSPTGNHHLAHEVMRDIGAAALCRYFILDGSSNVSVAIYCLAPSPERHTTWLRVPNMGNTWKGERILPRLATTGPESVDIVSKL
ncbi:MAG: hypothetical protein FJX60_00540 [Alphaproteobacteria bacterium]|nr:hypothetical protein [Alphaproteobacteria bacterium]